MKIACFLQRYNLFMYRAVYARFVYDTKVLGALKRRTRRDMNDERGRFRNFSLTFHRNFRKGNAAKDTLRLFITLRKASFETASKPIVSSNEITGEMIIETKSYRRCSYHRLCPPLLNFAKTPKPTRCV